MHVTKSHTIDLRISFSSSESQRKNLLKVSLGYARYADSELTCMTLMFVVLDVYVIFITDRDADAFSILF